jgi:hypothetical protein
MARLRVITNLGVSEAGTLPRFAYQPNALSRSSRPCSPQLATAKLMRMDNGAKLISQALQRSCEGRMGCPNISSASPWEAATFNHSATDCEGLPQPQPLEPRPSKLRHAGTLTKRCLRDRLNPQRQPALQNRVDSATGTRQNHLGSFKKVAWK